eukprot:m.100142 g.100142  ORF g.100142 m.100142 type:complete len:469 (+) comp22212_c0_seq1:3-1409(+)
MLLFLLVFLDCSLLKTSAVTPEEVEYEHEDGYDICTVDAFPELVAAFRFSQQCRHVESHFNDFSAITPDEWTTFETYFLKQRHTESLTIANCKLGLNFAIMMERALPHVVHTPLRLLDLSDNSLGFVGVTKIATGLKLMAKAGGKSEGLVTLKLNNVKARDPGAESIADALLSNQRLTSLHMRNNLFGPNAVKAFVELATSRDSALVLLDLGENQIGDMGAFSFYEALPRFASVQTLDLQHCVISTQQAHKLYHLGEEHNVAVVVPHMHLLNSADETRGKLDELVHGELEIEEGQGESSEGDDRHLSFKQGNVDVEEDVAESNTTETDGAAGAGPYNDEYYEEFKRKLLEKYRSEMRGYQADGSYVPPLEQPRNVFEGMTTEARMLVINAKLMHYAETFVQNGVKTKYDLKNVSDEKLKELGLGRREISRLRVEVGHHFQRRKQLDRMMQQHQDRVQEFNTPPPHEEL